MSSDIEVSRFRRRALMLGGSITAGFATNLFPQVASAAGDAPEGPTVHPGEKLPVKEIEGILRTDGKVTNGILAISLYRWIVRIFMSRVQAAFRSSQPGR